MNGTTRYAPIAVLTLLLSVRTMAGDPATVIVEEEANQEMASGVHKIIQPGATQAATKIGQTLMDVAAGIGTVAASGAAVSTDSGDEARPAAVEIPPGFKPWEIRFGEGAQEIAPGQHNGDENRLRRNLSKAGWDCPKGYAAHHIVNKGDSPYSNNSHYKALRECLDKWQIDIDSAGNGICLPNSAKAVAKDPAVPHRGRERDIHGPEITGYMMGICEEVESKAELQQYLDKWRALLARGKLPWEVSPLDY